MFGSALGLTGGIALATAFWTTGLVDGAYVADLQNRLDTAQTGPGLAIGVLIAFAVGASMVVLPCGFPAVFAVPAIVEREPNSRRRLRALAAFGLGGVLPLAVVGLALGLAGDAIWGTAAGRRVAEDLRRRRLLDGGRGRDPVRAPSSGSGISKAHSPA